MNKVLFFGNFYGGNGPAEVNRNLRNSLENKNVIFLDDLSKKELLKKWLKNFIKSDNIHLSGINGTISLLTIILARLLNKKVTYTCHGCIKLEDNNAKIKNKIIEALYLKLSNEIVMLSKVFANEVKKVYPEYSNKFVIIPNGYEYNNSLYNNSFIKDKKKKIVSIGGGRNNKGNIQVCKALEKIKDTIDFEYIVIGEDGKDTDEIRKYEFVNYMGRISHEDVLEVFGKSHLFVQYSTLESFGIAPLEALNAQCDVLISPNLGVKEVFTDISEEIVFNCKNIDELSNVIKKKLVNTKIYSEFNYYTWEEVAKRYLVLWEER